jgi:hypothetical protein
MVNMKRSYVHVASLVVVACILLTIPGGKADSQTPAATAAATAETDFRAWAEQVAKGPHRTITSSDGRATLLIPENALPDDVDATAIKITLQKAFRTPVAPDRTPPLFAYHLEPDGLRFKSPALIRIATNLPNTARGPMLFLVSGETVEPLSPAAIERDPDTGKIAVAARITHFSDVVGTGGWFDLTTTYPGDRVLNDPFTLNVVVSVQGYGRYAVNRWTLKGEWAAGSRIDPSLVYDAPPETLTNGKSFSLSQRFKCIEAGFVRKILYVAVIDFEFTRFAERHNARVTDTNKDDAPFRCVPLITRFVAEFIPAARATHYTVRAFDPDGDTLSFLWSNTNTCGTFTWNSKSPKAVWVHPHTSIGGNCPDEEVHPGTISVTVSDGNGIVETFAYEGGSASGIPLDLK